MKKKSRKIVITGATGDIAQALVRLLPEDELILLSRSKVRLVELYGKERAAYYFEQLDEVVAAFPEVDILINNAGFAVFKPFDELTQAEIGAMFQVNSLDPIATIKSLNPRLQIVNIASVAGKIPSSKSTAYAASKSALITFSDALRLETEVIVTTVNTGPVRTKFHAENPDYLKKVGKHAMTAEEVAQKIVSILGKNKRELNLPWQMAVLVKLRGLFPALIDSIGKKYFNYK